MAIAPKKAMLRALAGETVSPMPVWLMRQAGRYLPEYRATRAEAGSFLDLCYSPKHATEVTLQPIRRYGFDASILFSDILVVPHALGQAVTFEEGHGPRLEPITDEAGFARLSERLDPDKVVRVCETVANLADQLPDHVTLIGFCGAPWTVATYMIAGEGSSDQEAARLLAYRNPALFGKIIDRLVDASIAYLDRQIRAGAEVVQIFDSWAGTLPDHEFEAWVIEPTARIVMALSRQHPDVPILGFPRGAGSRMAGFVKATGVDGVSCDTAVPLKAIAEDLQPLTTTQGNLDPLLLVAGGAALDARVDEIKATLGTRPHIFNLGHGIVPQTPPEHVSQLLARIRQG